MHNVSGGRQVGLPRHLTLEDALADVNSTTLPKRQRLEAFGVAVDTIASSTNDAFWIEVGQSLIALHVRHGRLDAMYVNKYVHACPDSVFRQIATEMPSGVYPRWDGKRKHLDL